MFFCVWCTADVLQPELLGTQDTVVCDARSTFGADAAALDVAIEWLAGERAALARCEMFKALVGESLIHLAFTFRGLRRNALRKYSITSIINSTKHGLPKETEQKHIGFRSSWWLKGTNCDYKLGKT